MLNFSPFPKHFISSHSSALLHILLLPFLSCCYNNHAQVSVVFNNTGLFLAYITCFLQVCFSSTPRIFFTLRPTLNEQPLSENDFPMWQREKNNVRKSWWIIKTCSEVAQNTHLFLAKASHMTKPDLNWGREILTSHRKTKQVIKNNDRVSRGSLYLKCHHTSSFSPFFKMYKAVLSPPLQIPPLGIRQLAHFSSFSQDSGPISNKVLVTLY